MEKSMTADQRRVTLDYLETRGCKIKKTFFSRKGAKKRAKEINITDDGSGRVRAYKCKFCPNYHIGHIKRPNLLGGPGEF